MGISFHREQEETDRLLALSDGVIAIAITLLVLEITVPEIPVGRPVSILSNLVFDQWHEFFSYVLSFLVIGNYWVLHRRIFLHIEAHDRSVVWLNLLFLLLVAFVPYGTSLFSMYPTRFGVVFYAGILALTGLILTLLWSYASRHDILEEGLTSTLVVLEGARFLASPLVFVFSIVVANFDTTLAILSWFLLLPINGVLQSRLVENLEQPEPV
ncbi:DUF1211 domain-containing protein [Haloferax sp. MBLA0076]|uniref:DUF1211 domain-containing protein n=1 Tax=Haloferax litoreum TaxID=2666140 RepID=A0A6A8GJ00_9EURY|nr:MULTISPECIES: TMEM175 family protein [Haloferax]KAB1194288.1 DUF1211 domain-containing protein [Haloferax sp. CBA1148]MRX22849.1 DUF1211 domain-containing protein [Haloferax litoreum]